MIGRAPSPAPVGPLRWQGALRDQLHNARLLSELCQPEAPQRIGVVACHAGAGASTVAMNLAAMLRERGDAPVWLVEAELRHPSLARSLGLADGGFNRLVDESAAFEDCAVTHPASGLKVLAARASGEPLPLLRRAAERLAEPPEGRMVVDLPPLLERPDASLMLPVLDGVLLVLEAEATRWEVAREARRRLDAAGATVLGAVLNKKPHPIPRWLYRLL